ncbi:NAD-glutamate dehydrogenase [Cellulomonas sp. ATA003]|nr:NAD-glutamate dehydrogenase domain-containing protein [Cellulomonas sp. ATA003]WNB85476.1 NAD-glutamate dehydrogenase [Cellulomonas sp. ATA003]
MLDVSPSAAGEDDGRALAADARVESWIRVEIDREPDEAALAALTSSLHGVLDDVRAAVEDWPAMRTAALTLARELREQPPSDLEGEAAEAARFLDWLADDNFTFLGYREYALADAGGEEALSAAPGSGLGILRSAAGQNSGGFSRLPARARAKARERRVLVLTKANSRATVHRPAYLDYVGVKSFDSTGRVVGERRFLGLFSVAAYTESVRRVPLVDAKVDAVLARSGFAPDSHSGKDLQAILETYPRDELFQVDVEELYTTALAVLRLQERRRTRLFLRREVYGRYMSALVFLPRDRYTTAIRLRIEGILKDALHAESVDFTTRVSESVLARLHFVLRVAPGDEVPDVDERALEARLVDACRSWEEDLAESLRDDLGDEVAARMQRVWGGSFPEAYKEDFPASVAVGDLRRLDRLAADTRDRAAAGDAGAVERAFATDLYRPPGADPQERRFKLFRYAPLSLTAVLPYFRNLGVEVIDERPYHLRRPDSTTAWIYDFGLRFPVQAASDDAHTTFTEAFLAAWQGSTESDGLDHLVLRAGLTWRQVVILRAYTKYLHQAGSTFSQDYVEGCLAANVGITGLLVQLFEARFLPTDAAGPADGAPDGADGTPDGAPDADVAGRAEAAAALTERIEAALDDVASLDHDRILRSLLRVITATLRTNFYQRDATGRPKDYTSFKIDPTRLPDLPEPRPAFEIWVYAPTVEGVHLRFGAVARGGLRWSDRREDFRTEVLGLVKAQMVKNAVIVPTGAKGGFVGKALPDPAVDRDAWLAEGVRCYRTFIRGLLDVTDNIVADDSAPGGRRVQPPPRVVRHDGDDAYLVVAADKGTASFSDIANAVSAEYGHWLGDAFASGGSAGYDHKAMGITARGAWESVKRHFRELGVDTQSQEVTVVGVGDMSGDVFGNGMLLSEHIRLVAAFDHRHIFLDPDPDAAASFAERRRLFGLPRSSWADYDPALISPGGGVHPGPRSRSRSPPRWPGCSAWRAGPPT